MIKRLVFTAMLTVSFCSSAADTYLSGKELLDSLRSSSDVQRRAALGYILGVHDAIAALAEAGKVKPICSPKKLNSGQLHDVVKKYIEENQSMLQSSASEFVLVALSKSFPCK